MSESLKTLLLLLLLALIVYGVTSYLPAPVPTVGRFIAVIISLFGLITFFVAFLNNPTVLK